MATNSTIQTLTKLIIMSALDERPCSGLMLAYEEEFGALCEDEDRDLAEALDRVESAEDCERIMAAEFTHNYRAAIDHEVSDETCLDVFMYPATLPCAGVPRRLLQLVGREMARRDARMANGVRRAMMARASA